MQYFWINQQKENKKLILFFNGWAMNETPVKHLKTEDFDVLVLFDYRNIDFDFSQFDFSRYEQKYLISWSMGVYVSNLFESELKDFNRKIAINGTTKIIDNDFGIPEKIYKVTVKFLNEDSCDKFIKNMFDNGKLNPNITITRSLNELKDELISIQKIELNDKLEYDLALISDNDRIVPTKNQINFWKDKTKNRIINSTHCPFDKFQTWSDLLC